MDGSPLLGVFFHWLGGVSSASFYVPYKRIKLWSWEIFWLTGGVFSWLLVPWLIASIQTNNLLGVLSQAPFTTLLWCWFWGAMWGFGGLTFGLTMHYLGLSLGMAVVLGLTTVIGTMGPPIFHGTMGSLATSIGGRFTLLGIVMTLLGIWVVFNAGKAKEKDLDARDNQSIAKFDLRKGLLIAGFSGVMSGCFAFGLDAGQPIRDLAIAAGTNKLWQGLPVLCVVLVGGFTTNFIWCLYLIRKNKSGAEFTGNGNAEGANLLLNYSLAILGGTLWYFQFFFYTMGESQMGKYGFSSWTLHMASIILFSTLWGFALKEWTGASSYTRKLVWIGIGLLVGSTIVIGLGNMLLA